jgi:NAD-dependent dihydropyrimidine dehydrogenase PreA subunit
MLAAPEDASPPMANANIVLIDPAVCEKCNICVEEFGCPAIQLGIGGGIPWIHEELCNGNGSCIQVCPIGAIVRPNMRKFAAPGTAPADVEAPEPPSDAPPKTSWGGRGSEVCK